jgi:hypothetical protein
MSGLALTQPAGIGLGLQEPFAPANPAAGAQVSFVCDGHGLRRLQSLVLTLTTSAVAGNRYLTVEWQGSDGKAYAVAAVAATLAASGTQRYVFALGEGSQAWNTGTDAFAPLPPVFLSPGDSLVTVLAAGDVGDTITSIRGVMERFPLDGVGLPASEGDA